MVATQNNPPSAKPRGYFRWPIIVIGLLGLHVVLMAATAVIASRDRSFVVVPDYYKRAVQWDKNQAQLRESARLGWQVTLTPEKQVDPMGRRKVMIEVRRADGSPVAMALVELDYYQHARGNELLKASLHCDESGRASGMIPMRYPGFYDIRIAAAAGQEKFITRLTQYVEK